MTKLQQAAVHDRTNLEAAAIVLEDPVRYGGDEALLVKWARAVTEADEGRRLAHWFASLSQE